MRKITLLLVVLCVTTLMSCHNNTSPPPPNKNMPDTLVSKQGTVTYSNDDSTSLLLLTQNLYQWAEQDSKGIDFAPYLANPQDTVYAGINLQSHKKRLKEMARTGFFTEGFIENYNKIAMAIDSTIKSEALIWQSGSLPPFGNGASPWCKCQDVPEHYLTKIWIMQLSFDKDTASYNWSWGEGLVYHIKAVKERGAWRIADMEGFDYDAFIRSFIYINHISGSWENGLIRMDISDTSLALWYHGQCIYFYPIRQISPQTIEMIWDRDMDCKFDNGTHQKFGLKQVPVKGEPFAKFTLKDNTLYARYYYNEWVQQYSKRVQSEVFTASYSRRLQQY